MIKLSLVDAFAKYGGTPANRLYSFSAIAADGALILRCSAERFGHPAQGVLRYEDTLPRDASRKTEAAALSSHLTQARDGKLPVRLIIVAEKTKASGGTTRDIYIRADLVGNVVEFDGDHYIVDFVREGSPAATQRLAAR